MASLRKSANKKAEEEKAPVKEQVAVKEETSPEPKQEVKVLEVQKPAQKEQPMVRVVLNKDLSTYIGDQWWNFKEGKQYNVPQNVKEILNRAGLLQVI